MNQLKLTQANMVHFSMTAFIIYQGHCIKGNNP